MPATAGTWGLFIEDVSINGDDGVLTEWCIDFSYKTEPHLRRTEVPFFICASNELTPCYESYYPQVFGNTFGLARSKPNGLCNLLSFFDSEQWYSSDVMTQPGSFYMIDASLTDPAGTPLSVQVFFESDLLAAGSSTNLMPVTESSCQSADNQPLFEGTSTASC